MAKKKKPTVKQRAKKAGKKVKKAVKTDVGRAGIGAGAGALVLGPVGAVAGAGIAMATKDKKKKRKKNPGPTAKLSTAMGNLLLDYHRASDAVEHVAASALRGERVELRHLKKARSDLAKIKKIQVSAGEKEQIGHLVEALDRVIKKAERKGNPARAYSLETEVKRGRQRKAKRAAGRSSAASAAARDASRLSLKKRLAKLNPGTYRDQVKGMSASQLDSEHKAINSLIARARRHPETSKRMEGDLVKIRGYIVSEKKARRAGGHSVPISNPRTVSRKKGRYHKTFTPNKEEMRLLRKYGMMDKLEDVGPEQIERIVARLQRQEKAELAKEDTTAMKLAKSYRKARDEYQLLVTTPGSTEGEIARAKRKLDKAEDAITLYAEMRNMDPERLALFVAHAKSKQRQAKSRRSTAASNPLKKVTERTPEKKFRDAVSQNIATEMRAGKKQKQAVAIALSQARKQAPKKTKKLYGPKPNPSTLEGDFRDYVDYARFLGGSSAHGLKGKKLTKKEQLDRLVDACKFEELGPCTAAQFRKAKAVIMRDSNPRSIARKKGGGFVTTFTPDAEEMRLLRKYGMMDKLDGVGPDQIESIVERLRRHEKGKAHGHVKKMKVKYIVVGRGRSQRFGSESALLAKYKKVGTRPAKIAGRPVKKELAGQPELEGLIGPMWDGDRVRYETQEAYDAMSNPKKSKAKKKVASKKKAPAAKALINKCRKLWDHYCERPSKKRLKEVLEHLEKMKASSAKSVKEERSRCLRVANKEARRLGMKK